MSNQSYFRETGWVKKLAALLHEALREQDSPEGVAEWARPQRDKNLWGLLVVIRLFLLKGSIGSQSNQKSFWHSGVLVQVLDIAFHRSMDMTIRAEVRIDNHLGHYRSTDACLLGFGDHCRPHTGQRRSAGSVRTT